MSVALIEEDPRTIPYKGLYAGPGGRNDSYTCYSCNRGWHHDDPGFDYYHIITAGPHKGQKADGRDGRCYSSKGWFARCVNREACEARRRNRHTGVADFQLGFDA
jgi:hypothetical protein